MGADGARTTREVAEALLLDGPQRAKLVAFARVRFGIGREDAEDVLQDTALELLRQRQYVRNPDGYVFTVFRARCGRFTKASLVRQAVLASGEDLSAVTSDEQVAATLDRKVALRQALGEISSSCRRLLSAYYVEGQSLKDAAGIAALAPSSVAKTISRCLQRLRACLM